jgi:hypothetical protein
LAPSARETQISGGDLWLGVKAAVGPGRDLLHAAAIGVDTEQIEEELVLLRREPVEAWRTG